MVMRAIDTRQGSGRRGGVGVVMVVVMVAMVVGMIVHGLSYFK
jgi:hypothetical protein